MNKSHRSIWNESLGAWVAASEITSARGKRSRSSKTIIAGLGASLLFSGGGAMASGNVQLGNGQSPQGTMCFNAELGSATAASTFTCIVAQANGGFATVTGVGVKEDPSNPGQFVADGGLAEAWANANLTGTGAMAAGNQTTSAKGVNSIAYGNGAQANGLNSIAVGTGAVAGEETVAIGAMAGALPTGTAATGNVVIGSAAGYTSNGNSNTAVGNSAGAFVEGGQNSAFGVNAGQRINGTHNTAIGSSSGSEAQGSYNSALGNRAGNRVTGDTNVAIGVQAGQDVFGNRNIAIGNNAGNAVGTAAAPVSDTIAIGDAAKGSGQHSIAVGTGSAATGVGGVGSVAIGGGDVSIAARTNIAAKGSTAVGFGSQANPSAGDKQGGSAYGTYAQANNGSYNTALGYSAKANAAAVQADGFAGALAVGAFANASGSLGTALGSTAKAINAGDVALGAGSVTAAPTVPFYVPPGANAATIQGTTPTSVVSVGTGVAGGERRITNVAAGGAPTDAVNVSQLQAVASAAGSSKVKYFSVSSTGGTNDDSLGATGTDAIAIGRNAVAADAGSFAAGLGATSLAANSVAVGTGANASGGSIGTGAGGLGSNVLAPGSVAIGNNAVSSNAFLANPNVVIGNNALARTQSGNNVSIGNNARNTSIYGQDVLIGANSSIDSPSGGAQVVIGTGAHSNSVFGGAMALGNGAQTLTGVISGGALAVGGAPRPAAMAPWRWAGKPPAVAGSRRRSGFGLRPRAIRPRRSARVRRAPTVARSPSARRVPRRGWTTSSARGPLAWIRWPSAPRRLPTRPTPLPWARARRRPACKVPPWAPPPTPMAKARWPWATARKRLAKTPRLWAICPRPPKTWPRVGAAASPLAPLLKRPRAAFSWALALARVLRSRTRPALGRAMGQAPTVRGTTTRRSATSRAATCKARATWLLATALAAAASGLH